MAAEYPEERSSLNCRVCNIEMQHMGWYPFTVGLPSYSGDAVAMDVYRCPKCLTVELRADEDSEVYNRIGRHRKDIERNSVRQRGLSTKRCAGCGERIPIASEECPRCAARQPEWKRS